MRSTRLPLLAAALLGCVSGVPPGVGGFPPCPASPNCVSSEAQSEQHGIAPLRFEGDATAAWARARSAVLGLPRTRILSETGTTLHAECTTALMRYRDDLVLRLDAERGEIAVRSSSRVGYGDMGANRARVEALRAAFAARSPTPDAER